MIIDHASLVDASNELVTVETHGLHAVSEAVSEETMGISSGQPLHTQLVVVVEVAAGSAETCEEYEREADREFDSEFASANSKADCCADISKLTSSLAIEGNAGSIVDATHVLIDGHHTEGYGAG